MKLNLEEGEDNCYSFDLYRDLSSGRLSDCSGSDEEKIFADSQDTDFSTDLYNMDMPCYEAFKIVDNEAVEHADSREKCIPNDYLNVHEDMMDTINILSPHVCTIFERSYQADASTVNSSDVHLQVGAHFGC